MSPVESLQAKLQAARVTIALYRLQGVPEWAAMEAELKDFVHKRTTYSMNPDTPLEEVSRARIEVWMASWFRERTNIAPEALSKLAEDIASLRKRLDMLQNTSSSVVAPSELLAEADQLLQQFPKVRQQWNRSPNFVS